MPFSAFRRKIESNTAVYSITLRPLILIRLYSRRAVLLLGACGWERERPMQSHSTRTPVIEWLMRNPRRRFKRIRHPHMLLAWRVLVRLCSAGGARAGTRPPSRRCSRPTLTRSKWPTTCASAACGPSSRRVAPPPSRRPAAAAPACAVVSPFVHARAHTPPHACVSVWPALAERHGKAHARRECTRSLSRSRMRHARSGCGAGVGPDGALYVVGGSPDGPRSPV